MKIGYSTIACPNWSLEEAFNNGAAYGYAGLELAFIDGQWVTPRLLKENQRRIRDLSESSGCRAFAIAPHIELGIEGITGRTKALSEAQTFIELAGEIGADLLRLFGGVPIHPANDEEIIRVLSEDLARLDDVAVSKGVKIALESHGHFSSSRRLAKLLDKVDSPRILALWDLLHPTRVGEPVPVVWQHLVDRLGYLHLKDARREGDDEWGQVRLGEGDVPVREALRALAMRGFDGFAAVEWEKANHPHLAEPEDVLPGELAKIVEYTIDLA